MEDVFILGAGGLAREVWFLIQDINLAKPSYRVKGFVDAKKSALSMKLGGQNFDVIDEVEFLKSGNSAGLLAIGIGDPGVLKAVSKKFAEHRFVTLIHPTFVGHRESISMGRGNIITAGCIFTVDIQVGALNFFNLNSTVGHDAVVGSGNVFNPGSNISGGVKIGDNNLIGTNASILQYVKMGSGSVLGANAVLTKDLGDSVVAIGVPAKPLQK